MDRAALLRTAIAGQATTIAVEVVATLVLTDLISLVPARRVAFMNTADALRV
jgi:uncharacterized membrane protein